MIFNASITTMPEYPKPSPRSKKQPKPLPPFSAKRKALMDAGLFVPKERTPLKTSGKPIKQVSAKQAGKVAAIRKAKEAKAEINPMECEACGAWGMCTPSHIVPQGKSFELADKVWNIHWHCQYPCHDDCESGHFWKMKDGLKIMEILWQHRPERFWKFYFDQPQNQAIWQMSSFFNPEITVYETP